MPTKTEICNMALSYIGISIELTDVDTDATAAAKACLRFYDTSRDDVLRAYPWPFATKIAALAGKANNPNAEWAFSYTYPADAIAIRKILNTAVRLAAEKSRVPFRRNDAQVWTNVDNASIEYTWKVTDTTKFPSDFCELLSLLLASRIGPRLMKGDQLKLADRAYEKYGAQLQQALQTLQIEERELEEEVTAAGSPKENICNAALAHLGVDHEIQNLSTEKSMPARVMRQFYDVVRDETLRSLPWSFATKIAALAGKAAAPNVEWGFSYTYPADCIQVRKILDAAGRIPHMTSRVPFKLATGALIYTDVDNASLEYTMRHDTPSQYPADFINQMALLLAIRAAPRLLMKTPAVFKVQVERLQGLYDRGLQAAAQNAMLEERNLSPETTAAGEPKENICNEALMHLGLDHELQDLETEQTRVARVLRQFYDNTRDNVLRSFPWPVARKVATLALVASDPTEEWAYSYRYPSDAVQLRRILSGSRQDTQTSKVPYQLANDGTGFLLYTDEPDAKIEYTVRLDNPTIYYTPDLKNALALELALQIAPALLTDVKVRNAVMQEIRIKLSHQMAQTQANMANEEQPDQELDSEFVRSR